MSVACATIMSACSNSTSSGSSAAATNTETSENSTTVSACNLDDASEGNYAPLLKDNFGIDAKELEEEGFKIIDVRGSDYTTGFQLTLTYTTGDDDTAAFQNAFKEKLFNVTKAASGGVNYKCDDKGYITDETITEYSALNSASYDLGKWYFKYNGSEILVNVTAGSSVWIQLTGHRK